MNRIKAIALAFLVAAALCATGACLVPLWSVSIALGISAFVCAAGAWLIGTNGILGG